MASTKRKKKTAVRKPAKKNSPKNATKTAAQRDEIKRLAGDTKGLDKAVGVINQAAKTFDTLKKDVKDLGLPSRKVTIPAGLSYFLYQKGKPLDGVEIAQLIYEGVLPESADTTRKQPTPEKNDALLMITQTLFKYDEKGQNEILAHLLSELRTKRQNKVKALQSDHQFIDKELEKHSGHLNAFEAILSGKFEELNFTRTMG